MDEQPILPAAVRASLPPVVYSYFGLPIGVGSVPTLCQETSSALDDACLAVAEQVRTAAHVNVDETGWKQTGARRSLWTVVAAQALALLED